MKPYYGKTGRLNIDRIYSALFVSVGSPYALSRLEALRKGIIGSEMPDPTAYTDATSFAYDYCCHTALKKLRVAGDVSRLTQEAIDRFKKIDAGVRTWNYRLQHATNVEGVISHARRKIAAVLGKFRVDEFVLASGWGPGATASLKAHDATVDRKVLEPRLSVSPRAVKWAAAVLNSSPAWQRARLGTSIDGPCSLLDPFDIRDASRFTTVDKDWKTRRSIDIQPTLNLYLQKGVGKCIRRRLKRCGIDLDDQSRNQLLARQAFTSGYATIDLANASDTIPSELVYLLLPPDWYAILRDLRTDFTEIDGKKLYLHKFSAMGNGYTFELESLIFYALAHAVVRVEGDDVEGPIGIYGDDIVVPQRHAARLIGVLESVGFSVNTDKTYTSGNFYESCGKHYFKGVDVTPLFQKEELVDAPALCRAANRLYRWAERLGLGLCLDDVAHLPWTLAVSIGHSLHRERFCGRGKQHPLPTQPSYIEGDFGFLGISDSTRTTAYRFCPQKQPAEVSALLCETLRSPPELPYGGFVQPRGKGKYHLTYQKYRYESGRGLSWLTLRVGNLS